MFPKFRFQFITLPVARKRPSGQLQSQALVRMEPDSFEITQAAMDAVAPSAYAFASAHDLGVRGGIIFG